MLVCHCRGISDRQIRRLVRNGATSTREVARATGVGLDCGGCRSNVKQIVNQALEREFHNSQGTSFLDLALPVEG